MLLPIHKKTNNTIFYLEICCTIQPDNRSGIQFDTMKMVYFDRPLSRAPSSQNHDHDPIPPQMRWFFFCFVSLLLSLTVTLTITLATWSNNNKPYNRLRRIFKSWKMLLLNTFNVNYQFYDIEYVYTLSSHNGY